MMYLAYRYGANDPIGKEMNLIEEASGEQYQT
jgi:hypothetical protein